MATIRKTLTFTFFVGIIFFGILTAAARDNVATTPPAVKKSALQPPATEACMAPDKRADLLKTWAAQKTPRKAALLKGVTLGDDQAFYYAQVYTNNLLRAAFACRELDVLNEIAELLLVPFQEQFLREKSGYKLWTDKLGSELNELSISQYLYEVSLAMRYFLTLKTEQRTPAMNSLIAQYPVILHNFYERWVFKDGIFSFQKSGCDPSKLIVWNRAVTFTGWVKTQSPELSILKMASEAFSIGIKEGKLFANVGGSDHALFNKDNLKILKGKTVLNDNQWHFVALSLNPELKQWNLFLDGNSEATETYENAIPSNLGKILLGSEGTAKAALDEVMIFDQALLPKDVLDLKNCQQNGKVCQFKAAPLVHWSFELDPKNRQALRFAALELSPKAQRVPNGIYGSAVETTSGEWATTPEWSKMLNHYEFMSGKYQATPLSSLESKDHCYAIKDQDLWILAGSVELLAAQRVAASHGLNLQNSEYPFADYWATTVRLLQSRMEKTNLVNFSGQPVNGLILDGALWNAYKDHRFAGYQGKNFPAIKREVSPKATSWDIGHAGRFVNVFETLHNHQGMLNMDFPSTADMTMLANQFAYGVFNKDLKQPLFANYFSGVNGWYRVNYSDRTGFGYGPFDLSVAAVNGGYGFWKKYNPDIEVISKSVYEVLTSETPEQVEFRQKHYDIYWKNHTRTAPTKFGKDTSIHMLMFLPVFADEIKQQ